MSGPVHLLPARYQRRPVSPSITPVTPMGHYSAVAVSGLITGSGITAASPLFALRWSPPATVDSETVCVITRLTAFGLITTAFGSAQEFGLDAYIARGFTASYAGGSALTPFSTNAQKAKTSMGTSIMADMRIAGTGALTGGTVALDPEPFVSSGHWLSTGTANLLDRQWSQAASEFPPTLALNEGLVIANSVAFGASGVVRLQVMINWIEAPCFNTPP